jgi:hypothetical protein
LLPASLDYYALTPETETDHVELLRATIPPPAN